MNSSIVTAFITIKCCKNKINVSNVAQWDRADLGFEKPPEKTIYRSVLKEVGLHYVDKNSKWVFGISNNNKNNISSLRRINQFLDDTEEERVHCSIK